MKAMILAAMFAIFCNASFAGAFSDGIGSDDYTRYQARQASSVVNGTVVATRSIRVNGTTSYVGGAAGAAIGAVLANNMGNGNGRLVAAALGGLLGGIGGQAIERVATAETGVELQVKLDNGSEVVVMQGANEIFYPGDRVRVINGAGGFRITRM